MSRALLYSLHFTGHFVSKPALATLLTPTFAANFYKNEEKRYEGEWPEHGTGERDF